MKQVPAGRVPGTYAPALPADQLSLNELYFTIQGECRFQGLPTVFVRTSHCPLRCTWCFGPGTRILMGDWTWKRIADTVIGDVVIGRSERTRRLVRTIVTAKSIRERTTVLVNGTIVTTPDHKFLEGKRWRRVEKMVGRRAKFVAPPPPIEAVVDYERGYLAGVADGDGCFWSLKTGGKRPYRRFRLAMNDQAVLDAFQMRAQAAGFQLHDAKHGHAASFDGHVYNYDRMDALWLTTDSEAVRFEEWLDEDLVTPSWHRGYLAGIFDAEGSYSHTRGQGNHLRLSQHASVNPDVCQRIEKSLNELRFAYTKEKAGYLVHARRGGHHRFISWCRPARTHPTDLILGSKPVNWELIRDVVPTGRTDTVVDISTTDGSFVAEGFLVHNCDSQYTFTEGTPWPLDKIMKEVAKHPTKHVCLTGGEPLAQPSSVELCRRLAEAGYTIEVETSGSEDITPLNKLPATIRADIVVNLDVKCPGSAMTNFNRWANLDQLRPHDQLKFILLDRNDYDYAKKTLTEHPPPCEAFFHPVWKKLDPAQIADWVKQDGLKVRVGVQLHKYLWGDVRGV
ncbi:MAG TPA: hypothetical protein VI818_07825 [Candidatus Thermoplasmatota archaeon]|nr:hypothetical protein [Candidatus Thermoplasmatota archaeon]